MKSHTSRLAKLEAEAPAVKRYICIIHPDRVSEGYRVGEWYQTAKHITESESKPFNFTTRAELDAFAERPDVDLTIIEIAYASQAEGSQAANSDSVNV